MLQEDFLVNVAPFIPLNQFHHLFLVCKSWFEFLSNNSSLHRLVLSHYFKSMQSNETNRINQLIKQTSPELHQVITSSNNLIREPNIGNNQTEISKLFCTLAKRGILAVDNMVCFNKTPMKPKFINTKTNNAYKIVIENKELKNHICQVIAMSLISSTNTEIHHLCENNGHQIIVSANFNADLFQRDGLLMANVTKEQYKIVEFWLSSDGLKFINRKFVLTSNNNIQQQFSNRRFVFLEGCRGHILSYENIFDFRVAPVIALSLKQKYYGRGLHCNCSICSYQGRIHESIVQFVDFKNDRIKL